ncbi:hypothetical protein CEXT_163811 [Caerostris extrusa]|uniref:Uncharacterized protein n=1 Tax=Caerostris extrusa TaxID=172846 RepID=A0AAV4URM4_CAEEX|nr:hypothetical protein CEXT_163811 [Caerostris extrusa]
MDGTKYNSPSTIFIHSPQKNLKKHSGGTKKKKKPNLVCSGFFMLVVREKKRVYRKQQGKRSECLIFQKFIGKQGRIGMPTHPCLKHVSLCRRSFQLR